MAERDKPLDPLRKSHEDEFFLRHNQELIARLRERLAQESAVDDLKQQTPIHDDDVLHHLVQLGITKETLPVVHLVPLLQVAWADGEMAPSERELLEEAAREVNVVPGTPSWTLFEGWLNHRPSKEMFETALTYIKALLAALPEDQAAQARDNLQHLAHHVARATGGVLGIFGRVHADERAALDRIAERLAAHPKAHGIVEKL